MNLNIRRLRQSRNSFSRRWIIGNDRLLEVLHWDEDVDAQEDVALFLLDVGAEGEVQLPVNQLDADVADPVEAVRTHTVQQLLEAAFTDSDGSSTELRAVIYDRSRE